MAKATALPTIGPGERDLPAILDEVSALAPDRVLVDPALVAASARAWSADTVRAFLSDLRLWDDWCRHVRISSGAVRRAR